MWLMQAECWAYRRCSKFLPDASRHAWHLRCMERRIFSKILGVSRTHPATTTNLPTKSSDVATGVSYISPFKNPYKEKSKGDRSGDRGGHAIRPLRLIQPPGKVASKCALTSVLKFAGAPPCRNWICWQIGIRTIIQHFWQNLLQEC